MQMRRSSGILLHPTSLPGTPGIGTLGKNAFRFIDWLHEAGQTLWQVLPLGPTGYGDSPYASFSTFAGNPLLIDLDLLHDEKLLTAADIRPPEYIHTEGPVDFGAVVYWKMPLLKKAAENFLMRPKHPLAYYYAEFKTEQASWLDTYATFINIKTYYDGQAKQEKQSGKLWNNYWPADLASCNAAAVAAWQKRNDKDIEIQKVIQFFFFQQWRAVKAYAHGNGISIIGDIPIFVAVDSADVWSNQKYFQLNPDGTPRRVAGVPPDYFSKTGQLWGNPLYDWDAMKQDRYKWWVARIKASLNLVDYIRIDHFRGFESYWSVPAEEKTAVHGKWMPGPGREFFTEIRNILGNIPIIAEDLGVITEEVRALRDDCGFPGMKVLQFAFGDPETKQGGFANAFLPHMYTPNCVVYTGTHDNDTTQGWLDHASSAELQKIHDYLGGHVTPKNYCTEMIRIAMMSVAVFAVFPLQDIYEIGGDGRMNMPSTCGTNWSWRMEYTHFDSKKAAWLKQKTILYARNPICVSGTESGI